MTSPTPPTTPPPTSPPLTPGDEAANQQTLLTELKLEHHDLDASIARLEATPSLDELLLRRMKKRKLLLKDRIAAIERTLGPDLLA